MTRGLILMLVSLCVTQAAWAEKNVTRFLQSDARRETGDVHPPMKWSATENVLWKTDLPGLGWSSPVVWGDRVYLTTCVNTGKGAAPRKGLYIEDLDATKYPPAKDEHLWKVYCLDLNSGSIVWERTAHAGIPKMTHHLKNTLASETACTDGERVYAHFGNLGLFCYDMDGEPLWEHLIEPRQTRYGWGTAMSPIVYKDRVYLVNDNEEESSLLSLDKKTGEVIWEMPRDEKTNYSTPFIWENDERTELVISGINWVMSYDLEGKELWRIKGKSILAIPTPFEQFGLLYVTSGHVLWGENRIYAIRPGASGDLSPVEGEDIDEHLVWYQKQGPYHPTPLIVGEKLYMLLDRGFMMCFDAMTGEEIYGKQRIPMGRAFTSSPFTYGDTIFCINEDGVTFLIKPGEKFEVLDKNALADDDMCMATPVVLGDKLLIRTSARVYCIQDATQLTKAGE